MTMEIVQEEIKETRLAYCPDCEIVASKIWISHNYAWVPIGFLCKKCGYIEVWGIAESMTKDDSP